MVNYEICCSKNLATMEKLKLIFFIVFVKTKRFQVDSGNHRLLQTYICSIAESFNRSTHQFFAFSAADCEDFLFTFQSDKPKIHLL